METILGAIATAVMVIAEVWILVEVRKERIISELLLEHTVNKKERANIKRKATKLIKGILGER